MADKTYEMLWDCRFCGTNKLLGKTHRFCPNCGAAQDPSWRYFPSDAEKVAVEDHEFVGADKVCTACGALNAGNANNCGNCGAPLDSAKVAQSVGSQTRADGEAFEQEDLKARRRAQQEADMGRMSVTAQAPARARGGIPRWLIGVGAVAVLIISGLVAGLFITTEQNVVVTGHTWEREIVVQQFSAISDSAWDESVPVDAYSVTCRREQRETRRIPDGETCRTERIDQGDGTFRERQVCETRYREEPVYDDRCTFTVNRWVDSRSAVSSGDSLDDEPYWEDADLNDCRSERLGCEREGRREERYTLILAGNGSATYTCNLEQDAWEDADIEDTFTVAVNIYGSPSCDTLTPAR